MRYLKRFEGFNPDVSDTNTEVNDVVNQFRFILEDEEFDILPDARPGDVGIHCNIQCRDKSRLENLQSNPVFAEFVDRLCDALSGYKFILTRYVDPVRGSDLFKRRFTIEKLSNPTLYTPEERKLVNQRGGNTVSLDHFYTAATKQKYGLSFGK